MKKHLRLVSLVLSVNFVLSACGPGQMFGPTFTPTPTITPAFTLTPTLTPAPTLRPTRTMTSTPAPENLADAHDLRVWIEDYVHAYGGTVTVNGVARNANQLLGAVKVNPGSFIERKTIKGRETLFFVVNGVPLGIQTERTWRSILARDIADAKDAQFAMPVIWYQTWNPNFVKVIKNANMVTLAHDLNTDIVFEKLTTQD